MGHGLDGMSRLISSCNLSPLEVGCGRRSSQATAKGDSMPTPNPAPKSIYIQGIGHVSPRYAAMRESMKSLVETLTAESLDLDWDILNEETGRVRIIVSGLDRAKIAKQKIEVANKVRGEYSGIMLMNSKVRGYSIWCCHFSDGNFNTYACGFEFIMPGFEK